MRICAGKSGKVEGSSCGNRGQEYEDFKTIRAEKLLSALEKQFPGTVCNIENYWTSTPLTYNYYTGTPQGPCLVLCEIRTT
jgi:all-trans-retinol 13,14-reductase